MVLNFKLSLGGVPLRALALKVKRRGYPFVQQDFYESRPNKYLTLSVGFFTLLVAFPYFVLYGQYNVTYINPKPRRSFKNGILNLTEYFQWSIKLDRIKGKLIFK